MAGDRSQTLAARLAYGQRGCSDKQTDRQLSRNVITGGGSCNWVFRFVSSLHFLRPKFCIQSHRTHACYMPLLSHPT